MGLEKQKERISNQPTRFPDPLLLNARKNQVDGWRLEGEGLCDPQGMGTRVGKAATGVLLQTWEWACRIGTGGTEKEVKTYSKSTWFSSRLNLWISLGCPSYSYTSSTMGAGN